MKRKGVQQITKAPITTAIIVVILKVLSGHSSLGAWLGSFDPENKLEARQVFKNFNDTISREKHKPFTAA